AGARGYSQLLFWFGAGAIIGALLTAHRGAAPARGRALLLGFGGYGAAALVAVLVPWLSLAMVLLFLAGVSLVTAFSILNSLVQEAAPSEFRGRVVGIYGLFFRGGMPFGSLVAGFLVRAFGAPLTLAVFSGLLAMMALVVSLRSRRMQAL
ncbi:MAG TPA: MFS transporter, partial [Vicinamibacteria bacterium]|nr:MFS transporter [Vicinamibacteria bacterium]